MHEPHISPPLLLLLLLQPPSAAELVPSSHLSKQTPVGLQTLPLASPSRCSFVQARVKQGPCCSHQRPQLLLQLNRSSVGHAKRRSSSPSWASRRMMLLQQLLLLLLNRSSASPDSSSSRKQTQQRSSTLMTSGQMNGPAVNTELQVAAAMPAGTPASSTSALAAGSRRGQGSGRQQLQLA
jgi:hypothetical protein